MVRSLDVSKEVIDTTIVEVTIKVNDFYSKKNKLRLKCLDDFCC